MSDNILDITNKVTIIITNYNNGPHLRSCLESVVPQLNNSFNCVVIDDGSTDQSRDYLKTIKDNNRHLKIVFRPHFGVSAAKNYGLKIADGDYITFSDGDDYLMPNYTDNLYQFDAFSFDLTIASIIFKNESLNPPVTEHWNLNDKKYYEIGDFIDDYIKRRNLLTYSMSNKLYKRKLIVDNDINLGGNLSFGEDRIFNYKYFSICKNIQTCSFYQFKYIRRKCPSLSTKTVKDYFNIALFLHNSKINLLKKYSKNSTDLQIKQFANEDINNEINTALNRLHNFPKEKKYIINTVNKYIFKDEENIPQNIDVIMVLGSTKCKYRIEKAYEISKKYPSAIFLLTGGNKYYKYDNTEAEYMKKYLIKKNIPEDRIILENNAQHTKENITMSNELLNKYFGEKHLNILVVLAGFHINRVKYLINNNQEINKKYNYYFAYAYGPNTNPNNWFTNDLGRKIIFEELRKCIISGYLKI